MSVQKKYSFGNFLTKYQRIALSSLLLLLICFDYSMLRCLKDTVVVTASSAAVIPFLKVWAILPLAIFFTYVYVWLARRMINERVFYTLVFLFLAFFVLFALFIYPNRETFELTRLANFLRTVLPSGFYGLISMIEHWSLALFYTMAELWSNVILSILTWGFLNQITSLEEAKSSYSILGAASNIAAIFAGLAANAVLSINGDNAWDLNFRVMILVIAACGLLAMVVFYFLNRFVEQQEQKTVASGLKKRAEFSLSDSVKEILRSRHLTCLAIIVLGYFFAINTVEVLWKEQLRHACPNPSDFNRYMNTLTMMIGIFSTAFALVLPFLIRRFGWTKTALITPITMLVTSCFFFSSIVFDDRLAPWLVLLGTTPLMAAVFLGGVQNCLSKSAKYSVFDTTKEMAFIPLSRDEQLKGKAAIDGIGSRLGKSGASLAHQVMLLIFGGLAGSTAFVGSLMIMVIVGWIAATKILGMSIDKELAVVENDLEDAEELIEVTPAA